MTDGSLGIKIFLKKIQILSCQTLIYYNISKQFLSNFVFHTQKKWCYRGPWKELETLLYCFFYMNEVCELKKESEEVNCTNQLSSLWISASNYTPYKKRKEKMGVCLMPPV